MATIIQDVKRRISMSCATATTQHAQAEFSPWSFPEQTHWRSYIIV